MRQNGFYLLQQIQQETGVTHQHFVNRNHRMQLIRQMQQECVLEFTSFVLNMKAEVEDDVECSVAFHGTTSAL